MKSGRSEKSKRGARCIVPPQRKNRRRASGRWGEKCALLVAPVRDAVEWVVYTSRRESAMATAEQTVHVSEFTNEPFIDFKKPENRSRMEEALKKVKAEFGREYPMWLNGLKVTTAEKRTSTNPSRPSEIIGVFQNATVEMARQAVEDANKFFDTWKRVPSQERAKFLFGAAQIVRERKYELNALVCYEVGKTGVEAEADIAGTIDFLEFYGREMLRLGEPQKLTPMRGERNYLVYIPLGVGVIIPPWNFPCAIMAGMTAASLGLGNKGGVKAAAGSPTIA